MQKKKFSKQNQKNSYKIFDFLNKHLENFVAWSGGGSEMFTINIIPQAQTTQTTTAKKNLKISLFKFKKILDLERLKD